MKYVIDSSVAFKWVVKEPDKAKADQLRDDFSAGIHELLAPDVFPYEVAHALTRAERQGRISAGQALPLWVDVMATALICMPHCRFPLGLSAFPPVRTLACTIVFTSPSPNRSSANS